MKQPDRSINFEFHAGQNLLQVEAWYENDGGEPIVGDVECQMRDGDEFFNFDPDGLFILARDSGKRLTGGTAPLTEAIRVEAFRLAIRDIDERGAEEADLRADQYRDRQMDNPQLAAE